MDKGLHNAMQRTEGHGQDWSLPFSGYAALPPLWAVVMIKSNRLG